MARRWRDGPLCISAGDERRADILGESHRDIHIGAIIDFIRQAEAGLSIKELCRKGGLSDAILYKWRAKYGGMDVFDAKRLRDLAGENAKLKKLLAEAHLDIRALNAALGVAR